ncbi:MAG: protease modulator HflC [Candidatus Endonucleobacter bathymodioli]|uniref:Protein HflC n=1 Tax=Candidatus Endonucleibacter bathymodioli TaxID=539814 RepID=A0AA90P1L5_9GAMM|nr:protease modulator HflC [Candidatus Endonucleobacter bathymodioli]
MNQKTFSGLVAITGIALIAYSALFVISAREKAVQLRFGQITREDIAPGLHWKVPFIDQIKVFDGRLQTFDVPSERYLTLEKKAVIVDSFIKWKISDVYAFYKSTAGDLMRANALLAQRAESRMRNKFGGLTLTEVVSGQRDQLMDDITQSLDGVAQTELGVSIVDVRVKRIDLPPQVSDSVYDRMSSEREKEAQEYRAKGKEAAEVIMAGADREKRVLLANSYKKAEIIRGEGDAKAAEIYAKAYLQDSEFYAFSRSLQAYKAAFNDSSDMLLLAPDGDFFKYFNNMKGSNKK